MSRNISQTKGCCDICYEKRSLHVSVTLVSIRGHGVGQSSRRTTEARAAPRSHWRPFPQKMGPGCARHLPSRRAAAMALSSRGCSPSPRRRGGWTVAGVVGHGGRSVSPRSAFTAAFAAGAGWLSASVTRRIVRSWPRGIDNSPGLRYDG